MAWSAIGGHVRRASLLVQVSGREGRPLLRARARVESVSLLDDPQTVTYGEGV